MSSIVKIKLKTAKDSLGKKDYAKARDAASDVLSYEPDNYHANVFLGLALAELGENESSEQAYQKAIELNPSQVLGWQGIAKLYERSKKWEKYASTLQTLMNMYAKSDDATKCAETLQKYLEYWRQHGSRTEIISALEYLLPSSPFYPVLSSLPAPDPSAPTATTTFAIQSAIYNSLPIIEEIVDLTEKTEDEIFKREFDKRRTRINAGSASDVRKAVGLEIWKASKLPVLYNDIINHPNTSDERRRVVEGKLLRFKHQYLTALPIGDDLKTSLSKEVQDLIDGVVLLNIPDDLAWTLFMESKNVDSIDGYDFDVFRRFIALFPGLHLSSLLRAYFLYSGFSIKTEDGEAEDVEEAEGQSMAEESDPLDTVVDAFSNLQESILAHRILGDTYIVEEEYQDAVSIAEKGLQLAHQAEVENAISLDQVIKAFNVTLGTGLVHLFPPKHHARAIPILDEVLSVDEKCIPALMARGSILQAAKKWDGAVIIYGKIVKLARDADPAKSLAEEEHGWCLMHAGELDSAVGELQQVLDNVEASSEDNHRKAKLWWKLGECLWRMGGESRERAYKNYITSLKRSPSYAPAFTSLGIYYLECAEPSDPKRAAKCFQKAFELDAREVDAAQRLARSFAEEREWDLVEVVAKRTIEGEGGPGGAGTSGAQAIAAAAVKHSPTNAWAWKALGVVQLNSRQYAAAIQSFQVSLRSDDNDALSWLRLGEAYVGAGRYAAALKALQKSHELNPDDWVCTYQIGEVQRQTGLFSSAITTYESILSAHQDCEGTAVLMSLSETHLLLGRLERSTGFIGRSEASFLSSISVAIDILESSPGFRRLAWKTISDSLVELSEFSTFPDLEHVVDMLRRVASHLSSSTSTLFNGIIDNPLLVDPSSVGGRNALYFAISSCEKRLSFFAKDEDGIASAHFDLGVGLYRLAAAAVTDTVREKALKSAIDQVRLALLSDPTNASYWSMFANMHSSTDPRVAQHAYIKALELNNKDASVWTDLGLFYLTNGDAELANEALYRAQTLDPDYTLAWVGQGLVAVKNGHEQDADAVFEHAVSLTSDLPAADIEFASRIFSNITTKDQYSSTVVQERLLAPFFSLDRFCRRRSNDASVLHLFALVCERLHLTELAVQMMERAISILEAAYEESEDTIIEKRYAIANANLGRILLSSGDANAALEKLETAFGLLPTDDESLVAVRSMCQFASGIAHLQLGSLDNAIQLIESALEISQEFPPVRKQVAVMLAQALWIVGTEEFRETAKSHLLQCIGDDPENLPAVTALAAMGLLTDDETLIDAALSEMRTIPIDLRHERDPRGDVEDVLAKHHLAEMHVDEASAILEQAVHAEPSRVEPRLELASFLVAQGNPRAAAALLSSLLSGPVDLDVGQSQRALSIVSVALAAGGSASEMASAQKLAQRSVKLAPWESGNWISLAYSSATVNQ